MRITAIWLAIRFSNDRVTVAEQLALPAFVDEAVVDGLEVIRRSNAARSSCRLRVLSRLACIAARATGGNAGMLSKP